MTANDYILSGYEISKQVTEEVITRAESDVMTAYILPIIGSDAKKEDYRCEVMALAYCLLLRRNIVKTRFGSEVKVNQYGTVMQQENAMLNSQICGMCSIAISGLKGKTLSTENFNRVKDIIEFGYYKY